MNPITTTGEAREGKSHTRLPIIFPCHKNICTALEVVSSIPIAVRNFLFSFLTFGGSGIGNHGERKHPPAVLFALAAAAPAIQVVVEIGVPDHVAGGVSGRVQFCAAGKGEGAGVFDD